jgi:hypothetical protein
MDIKNNTLKTVLLKNVIKYIRYISSSTKNGELSQCCYILPFFVAVFIWRTVLDVVTSIVYLLFFFPLLSVEVTVYKYCKSPVVVLASIHCHYFGKPI